jgi:SAM-dependent methyltransferase
MQKVLHVGCGPATLIHLPKCFQSGGWREVRFDIDPACRPDIQGTILDMREVASQSMDAIYSSHNIEHVHYHEVPKVLSEFTRVLKPNGFCVITCPDIEAVATEILRIGLHAPLYKVSMGTITPNDILYGHSASIADGKVYMAHKTGFDVRLLGERIKEAGFGSNIGRRNPKNFDLWFVAFMQRLEDSELFAKYHQYTSFSKD